MTHRTSGNQGPADVGAPSEVADRSMAQEQSAPEAISDGVITAKIKVGLNADPITARYGIHVETFKGVVELSGFVETTSVRDEAVQLAQAVAGVRQVKDSLDIRRVDWHERSG